MVTDWGGGGVGGAAPPYQKGGGADPGPAPQSHNPSATPHTTAQQFISLNLHNLPTTHPLAPKVNENLSMAGS